MYDTFNDIFLLDTIDHYPIFTIVPINCPQRRIRVKFRDHSIQNIARLKLEVEHYVNNHVQINQDVQIISVTTYLLSIAIVVLSKKKKHLLHDLQAGISDAIMISLNRKHELFRLYDNGIVTFDNYNYFQHISISRENSQSALKIHSLPKDTWKTLNSLIRCKNMSKDVTPNHNGSSISDLSVIAEVFNNYFSNIASNLDRNIPHSNISPLNFHGAPCGKFFLPSL